MSRSAEYYRSPTALRKAQLAQDFEVIGAWLSPVLAIPALVIFSFQWEIVVPVFLVTGVLSLIRSHQNAEKIKQLKEPQIYGEYNYPRILRDRIRRP